jgi:hypothetical protein
MFSRQVVYSSPLHSGYFGDEGLALAQADLDSPILHLPHHWDNRDMSPHPVSSFAMSHEVLCVCVALGFELRVYTLSHSTSPIFMIFFFLR